MKRSPLVIAFILVNLVAFCQVKKLTVAQDGSGNFTSVQAAFDAVPVGNKQDILILIKKGIYKEKLHIDSGKNFILLTGEDKFSTIVTYDDHTGKVSPKGDIINTRTSFSFRVEGNDFTARNITFQNDAGFTAGQAVAVEADGDRASFFNCRFVGNQDVLFTSNDNSRQYYKNCYIEGTTDFIFGSSTVWFEQCHIHSKKNSHVTAASTPKEHSFGYVFHDCILTGDSTLRGVSLGRPWKSFASVAYIHCFIGEHIMPKGWSNWNNTENYKTARYAEYKNYGPGVSLSLRAEWVKQLSEQDVKVYTFENVFGDWIPYENKAQ